MEPKTDIIGLDCQPVASIGMRSPDMKLTRRPVLRASVAAVAVPAMARLPALAQGAAPAAAGASEWRHGLSPFGDIKYPAGFKHFEYVNPQAPQGGSVRRVAIGTFDNFNLVVSGVK